MKKLIEVLGQTCSTPKTTPLVLALILVIGIASLGFPWEPCKISSLSNNESVLVAQVSPPPLAISYISILGNRTRMVQVATVFMLVGIGFLMWKRH